MAMLSSLTPSAAYDFSRSAVVHIPLNESGDLLRPCRVVVDYSYKKEKEPRNTLSLIALKVFGALDFFCSFPRRYVTCLRQAEATLSPINFEDNFRLYIDQLRSRNPLGFEIVDTELYTEISAPPPYDEALLAKIQDVLAKQGMASSKERLAHVLTAREQAFVVHREMPSHIVCVSSKSPYFEKINSTLRIQNKRLDRTAGADEPSLCTASVRVFPNKASTLTIPGLERWKGGSKVINCEIYLDEDGKIQLMRRNKLRDDRRTRSYERLYHNSISTALSIKNPHILAPRVIFNHPKGIQFLTDSYPKDAFAFLADYYYFDPGAISTNPANARHIIESSIEQQICQALRYMMGVASALEALNNAGILHNDTKPENILIDSKKSVLFDFDFACTVSEGRTNKHLGGSLEYLPVHTTYKDPSTEMYSLALTYHMNSETRLHDHPSFMDVFVALQKLAEKKHPEFLPKIKNLIGCLQGLCEEMKKGYTECKRPALTYSDVITSLREMAAPFIHTCPTASGIN